MAVTSWPEGGNQISKYGMQLFCAYFELYQVKINPYFSTFSLKFHLVKFNMAHKKEQETTA